MSAPWNPVEGWDVPRGFYEDAPDPNEESFWEMIEDEFSKEAARSDGDDQ